MSHNDPVCIIETTNATPHPSNNGAILFHFDNKIERFQEPLIIEEDTGLNDQGYSSMR
jgi:hypothetical protein